MKEGGASFPRTIPELLAWRAARDEPGKAWLRFEGDRFTLAEVLAEVDRFAVGLAERGVGARDTVAILAGNRPETIFAWFAANRLGAIAAPLNPAAKAHELARSYALLRPRVVVATSELAPLAASDDVRVVTMDELGRGGQGSTAAAVDPDDVAVLLTTSGTTGAPKAVMQTHRTFALTAEAFPAWCGLDESDVLYCPLPLFHINAQAYSTIGSLGCGGTLALAPRFSASRFLDDIRRHGATEVNSVGAMLHILLGTESSPGDRDHALRLCYAALALPEAQHRAFEERFGVRMIVGYGLSETTFGTVWSRDEAAPYGTIGRLRQHPRPNAVGWNRGRVVTDEGREAADGEPGELWLANPAMMRGYLDDPAATHAVLDGEGWFRTGDVVRRDARGIYTFVARKKEVLRRRGENVAAAEIEGALLAHPAVGEAAVIGVPSPLGEDDIVGFVVLRPGSEAEGSAGPEALRAFVKERLADYKVPARIHLRDALPKTPTERIAKHQLRE